MSLIGVVISCSHVYRLKTGSFFAVKVVNCEGIQHVIFKCDQFNNEQEYSLENGNIYEFTDLKNAFIKGIPVFMAARTTRTAIIQGDIQTHLSCTGVHDLEVFPEDDFSYEGVVSDVLFHDCLYSLDEGRIHLCTAHLATATPELLKGNRVLIEHAHIIKKKKPYLLVCCGLTKIKQLGDEDNSNKQQINQLAHLIHKYEWNIASFKRIREIVEFLKDRLYPKFMNQDDFNTTEDILGRMNSYGMFEILLCCSHIYPEHCFKEEPKKNYSPLKEFLQQPHHCCALDGIEEELLPGIKFISVDETRRILDKKEYKDYPTWKYKEDMLGVSLNKVILVGLLDAFPDGTLCLTDNSGSIPCTISYQLQTSISGDNTCPIHQHFPMPRASYGHIVAISRFIIVEEACKMNGKSRNYILLEEDDLVVLKTKHAPINHEPMFSSKLEDPHLEVLRANTEHSCWYYLCQLIVPRVKTTQKDEKGGFQSFIDAIIISKSLVEVAFDANCEEIHTCPFQMATLSLDEDCGPIDFLEKKRRKKFLLEDSMQVQMVSGVIPGCPYLLEIPLSKHPGVANTLAQRFSAASNLSLAPGTRITPFTRHISQLCTKHSLKENTMKFHLLTDDCICSMADLKNTSISVICHENFFSEDYLNIDCTIKEKWITKEKESFNGALKICLLVSDYNPFENSVPGPAINVYLKGIFNSGQFQGLIPGRRLLISALRRFRSQLGNVYLTTTQDTFLQHPSMERNRVKTKQTIIPPLRTLFPLPLDYQWFDSLAVILKIYSVSITVGNLDPESTIIDLNIKAKFLMDDGTSQAVATCKDSCVQNLLLLMDHEWNFMLFLARNSPEGLLFDQNDRWRHGALDSAESRLLERLCLRSRVQRQTLLTCRQIGPKMTGLSEKGVARRMKILCSSIQTVKPSDVILRLLHHLKPNT